MNYILATNANGMHPVQYSTCAQNTESSTMFINLANKFVGYKETECASNISVIAQTAPEILQRSPYVLISKVDSTLCPKTTWPSVSKLIDRYGFYFRDTPNGLITDSNTLIIIATAHQFFNGFDELWLLEEDRYRIMETGLSIASKEWVNDSRNPSATFLQAIAWMHDAKATLGLADGVELNYIASNYLDAVMLDTITCS